MLNLVANNISLSVWGSLSPPDKSRKIQGGIALYIGLT